MSEVTVSDSRQPRHRTIDPMNLDDPSRFVEPPDSVPVSAHTASAEAAAVQHHAVIADWLRMVRSSPASRRRAHSETERAD